MITVSFSVWPVEHDWEPAVYDLFRLFPRVEMDFADRAAWDAFQASLERQGFTLREVETRLVQEGWWHPNVNAGRVHDHPANPGRGWSAASHRLCEPVYTKRDGT